MNELVSEGVEVSADGEQRVAPQRARPRGSHSARSARTCSARHTTFLESDGGPDSRWNATTGQHSSGLLRSSRRCRSATAEFLGEAPAARQRGHGGRVGPLDGGSYHGRYKEAGQRGWLEDVGVVEEAAVPRPPTSVSPLAQRHAASGRPTRRGS